MKYLQPYKLKYTIYKCNILCVLKMTNAKESVLELVWKRLPIHILHLPEYLEKITKIKL